VRKKKDASPASLGPLFGGRQVEVRTGAPTGPGTADTRLWTPGEPSSKGRILVGTSGYSFRDWVGPFYPPGTQTQNMLPYYAERFPVVEINVTYYRLPGRRVFEQIEKKTPDGFEFFVKLSGALTHQRERVDDDALEFVEAVQPLVEKGKYRGALAQFPFSFRNDAENRGYLDWLSRAYEPRPLVVEFRHGSWNVDDTYAFLSDRGLDFSCVHEPQFEGMFPPVARRTGDVAYVRLHGRNYRSWWEGSGSERYDYLYKQSELEEWVDKVRELAAEARVSYVFFNNCHRGQAVQNARSMGELLGAG